MQCESTRNKNIKNDDDDSECRVPFKNLNFEFYWILLNFFRFVWKCLESLVIGGKRTHERQWFDSKLLSSVDWHNYKALKKIMQFHFRLPYRNSNLCLLHKLQHKMHFLNTLCKTTQCYYSRYSVCVFVWFKTTIF